MPICQCCNADVNSVDKHHITSQSLGGTNDKFNITFICPNCHRDVHKGFIILEGMFMTTNGLILLWHHKDDTPITEEQPDTYTF